MQHAGMPRRAYLAVLAANGGLEAALLTPLLPLTLQSIVGNITASIQQVRLPTQNAGTMPLLDQGLNAVTVPSCSKMGPPWRKPTRWHPSSGPIAAC